MKTVDFVKLNIAWIERFYKVEHSDLDMLEHIEDYIEKGAMVFFAVEDEAVLATCMMNRIRTTFGRYAS